MERQDNQGEDSRDNPDDLSAESHLAHNFPDTENLPGLLVEGDIRLMDTGMPVD